MTWAADTRYTRLLQEHGPALLRLAILLTGNYAAGEDVVQDALIRVADKWSPGHSIAYLRKGVANGAVDLHRRRRESPTAEIGEIPYVQSGMIRIEDDESFFAMIQQLPTQQRQTLVLRYHADLDDRAIARLLRVSTETVRSNARRALETLRLEHNPQPRRGQ